jgi:hypothetical protein
MLNQLKVMLREELIEKGWSEKKINSLLKTVVDVDKVKQLFLDEVGYGEREFDEMVEDVEDEEVIEKQLPEDFMTKEEIQEHFKHTFIFEEKQLFGSHESLIFVVDGETDEQSDLKIIIFLMEDDMERNRIKLSYNDCCLLYSGRSEMRKMLDKIICRFE